MAHCAHFEGTGRRILGSNVLSIRAPAHTLLVAALPGQALTLTARRALESNDSDRLQLQSARATLRTPMNVDIKRAGKPPRKLQKLLRKLPPDPAPETVHQLRTQTRKLEAILHALSPADEGHERRLLKLLKPIRRAAGRVRDMDVLIAKTTNLPPHLQSEGLVRLVKHMAAIRNADAMRLHRQVKRRLKKARSLLKTFRRDLKRLEPPDHSGAPASSPRPQLLVQKLEHWPRLTQGNLHDFRKGVKELGYMLQLVPDHDEHRLEAYAKVKDTAGDWHDWLQLKCLADSVLDPTEDATMLSEISGILQEKFHTALDVANSLRRRGIETPQAA